MRLLFVDELKVLSDVDVLLIEGVMDADISYENLNQIVDNFNPSKDELAVIVSSTEAEPNKIIKQIENEKIPFVNLNLIKNIDVDSVSVAIQERLGLNTINHPYPKLNYESTLLTNGRFDIYLRLSESKYVKIFEANTIGFDQIIEQYTVKGVRNFYLDEDDFFFYLDSLKVRFSSKSEDPHENQSLQISLVEAIQEKVKALGVGQDIVSEVNLVTNRLFDEIENSGRIVYEKIQHLKESRHFYEHCLLITYLAPAIARELGFFSRGIVEKIVYAAIFHDIAFNEDDHHLAKYFDAQEINTLRWQDIKKIKNHPFEAQGIVSSLKFTPPDVEMIILGHHERPDGTGFPKGLRGEQVPLIACLFIVVEDFVSKYYTSNKGEFALEQCLEMIRPVYNIGNFKKIFSGLESLLR